MPSKYQIMRDLADKMQTEVLSSEPTYLAFLRTAARNYKYNFKEQLLIFEQKPDAIACAGIDVWNRLGRWVNKGTKGIALLDVSAPGHRLRYVFDLTDTNSYAGRTVKLWEMQFRHEEAVMEALADTLRIPKEEMQTFPEYLETITDVLVEDNYTDYFRDLMLHKADSLLEELDEQNTELELKHTMKSSILYMLLTRCGYDPAIYMDALDFSHIRDFDSPDVAAILGSAVSDISEVALREIGVTVQALERAEKNQNRTFAQSRQSGYNEAVRTNEGSEHHAGTELHQTGGLPDPRPGGAGGPEDRQVRDPAAQLPAGPSHGSLRRDAVQGNPEPAPGADRPGGQRDDGAADRADGQGRGRDGEAESGGSDGLGRRDEQHQGQGGGNRPAGSDLRLEDYPEGEPLFPSEDEQQNTIAEAEADKASAFVISQEDIDYILGEGSNYSDSKYRIYSQYLRQEPAADNAKFLKKEYGTGGVYPIGVEKKFAVDYDAKGIRIRLGNIVHPDADKLLNWPKVEKRIRELIQAGRYLTPEQLQRFPEWRQNQLRRQERQKVTAEILDIFRSYNDFLENTGSTEGKLNLYVLSDCLQSLVTGEKTTYTLREDNFVLPLVRTGLQQVIDANSHLTERAAAALETVNGEMFRHLEPSYDELNPPPKPKMEYRWSLGETVYLGMKQYELLLLSDTEVRLYDPSFPLINKELTREDFDKMVSENPLNDGHLVPVEAVTEEAVLKENVEEARKPTAEPRPVGRIEFLGSGGAVGERIEYTDAEELIAAVREENYAGAPMGIVLYRDENGETIPQDFIARMDPPPKSFRTVDYARLALEQALAWRLTEFLRAYAPEEYYGLDDENALSQTKQILWDNGLISETIGQIELIIPEEGLQAEELEKAEKLIQDLLSLLPEHLRYTLYEDSALAEKRLGAPLPSPEELDRMRREAIFQPVLEPVTVQAAPEQEPKPEATAAVNTDDRLDEMLRQAELAVDLAEQTGQNVFAFEEGNPLPVNLPANAETPAPDEEEKPEAEALPVPPKRVPARKLPPSVLHPEVKDADRHDYRITEDSIGVGTPTERYYNNVAAIRLLKKLEAEQRLATPEEQGVLARYVGWGGLASCFEETSSHFHELKGLLSEEEYASARASTLTAFYTPPVVIRSIYQTMEQMGFKRGNLLEPACGIGNFMGMLPNSMRDSKLYGVELDSVSGRIAQQLYQRASIAVQGYETTQLPDSFFDGAIGNVPFGQFKVEDKRYDKHNFLIHDYFFAKTLDKVRPGGIIALVTSKGTMDKENPAIRKYIAQRADLLGAIRLPNDTFKRAAGTDVTSDILFLQKRDRLIDIDPDWVSLDTDPNGIRMNRYFVQNPDMVLGEMQTVSGPYGPETACVPYGDQSLEELLSAAIQNIHADYTAMDLEEVTEEEAGQSLPADPSIRNFSYALVEGKLYYRQNSVMTPVELSLTGANRVKGMIGIRDSVRRLIEYQTEDYPDEMIVAERKELNRLYDAFVKSYGNLNTRANKSAFANDSSASLLSSLEVLDDEGRFVREADMFTKRTIKQKVVVTSVDTASEALAISLAEKAKVDMPFMMGLTGKTEQAILEDLEGVIFRNPQYSSDGAAPGVEQYLPADEYLSGNVRQKLREAKKSAEISPADYAANVKALEQVQPKDLSAAEISVRLGATWLPPEVVEDFMFQLLSTSRLNRWNIHVHYSRLTGEWSIEGRSSDPRNIKAISTYGTDRINAYKIIEQTLNLKDVRVMDYLEDENGRKVPVLNKKETAIAQGKQALIKQAFADWIWKDPGRRQKLCKLYNEKFNSTRPREYDGSHLNFVGINPEIQLRPHQVNAIAHILYGGNTLLAHVVGAGKTFEMVAAAQESKRLGLCHKSLFVVPNHLTEQWASEYLQLYPAANILVATKKDFETKNRKRFCSRIATGDYDAIIIGHSQFEKIPMSVERQQQILQQELEEIINGIAEAKRNRGDNFTIKQMEKAKKAAEIKLSHLNDQSRKDDVVTFEELGVDRLFVDEAHYYKNLAAFSKMRNVGGISQTEAQKSSDLYMKCRYLDEITGGRGVIFATGTPISNSMVEMYTMQKYLQYGLLEQQQLTHFDAWASTFGETVTAIELAPEGTGYRSKTRFSRFYNLPELMSMFKQTADIQTSDMLNLPVPKANYHNVVLKPSETQKEMVRSLSERAEKVRNRMVSSNEDNMLLITNDGRKLALDQRLMNDWLPDHGNSKVNACAANVYEIWQRTAEQRSTQMVFCDLSTPHNDGKFNIYDDLKKKLMEKGVPEEEIAYIHNAATEAQKKELFGKVRSGQIRVLIGSTQKMGAGTTVQKKLIALHHLDCPWRPSDLQQREGRIIRQGNENPEVEIYTYVTENTFDSYLYQLVEGKQKFIGQIMTSKSPVRSAEDVDEQALSYAEIKALCTGNPAIKEKMDLDIDVARLKLLKANHLSERYSLEDHIIHHYPAQIRALEQKAEGYSADIERVKENTLPSEDGFSPMVIEGTRHTEKKAAGSAILEACKAIQNSEPVPLGQYRGFEMELCFDPMFREYKITLIGALRHQVFLGSDVYGNIQRLDNALEGLPASLAKTQEGVKSAQQNLEQAKAELNKPFPFEEELATKSARLGELNALLDMDKPENEIVDGECGEYEAAPIIEKDLSR